MRLIPQPRHMEMREGSFRLRYSHRITLDASCGSDCYEFARLLAREVREQTGFSLMIDRRLTGGHPGIRLGLQEGLGAEGYTLTIDEAGVAILGGSEAGLLYGIQTLRQLLRQAGAALPCLFMEDSPALPVRGLFYDVTRCRIPTMDYMKQLADLCSFYKINQLHLYIEHTFLFDGLSEVWRDDTPLTAQDILELDNYCRHRKIDLVPSVATLGHLYKVLRTKTYHSLSELEEEAGAPFSFHQRMGHHTLNVTDAGSLELVYGLIDQFLPLFTSKLFNINGDEPFDLGRGRGKELADQVGTHQMYVDWIAKICRHVEDLGKQPLFWGDVILAHPETMKELPKDVICMNWDYAPEDREDHAQKLWEVGAKQYLCPGAQGWKQTVNLLDVAYANIRKMAALAHKYQAEGLLVTEWGDYGHLQDPESSRIGILYAAAMGWNRELPGEEELNQDISVVEYGDRSGRLVSVLRRLSRQAALEWGEAVELVEIQRGRIPGKTMEQFWKEFLPRLSRFLPCIQETNDTIDACQQELAELMSAMAPEARGRLLPYFLMSDGQKLLNRLLAYLDQKLLGHENPLAVDPKALAEELETWYYHYKELWLQSSREGELYRNGEVIFWLADYLRDEAAR